MTQDPANPGDEPRRDGHERADGADGPPPQQPPPAEPPSPEPPPDDGPPSYGTPGETGTPPAVGYPPPVAGAQAGYPPPGGYPPPTPGPEGGYPPSGAAPGYPPAAPAASGYSGPAFAVGDAISYGWRTVTSNLGPWILVALIFIGVNVAWNLITGSFDRFTDSYDFGDTSFAAASGITFTSVLLSVLGAIISYLITAFLTRGALDESAGRRPDVAAFFRIGNVVNVVLAAFLVTILTTVGLVLCILPGIAVAIFSAFVFYFTLDRGQDAISAIRSSWSVVAKNFGSVFLLLLALFGINVLGAIPCGLGLFVTIPLSYVAVAFAYRRLVGQVPA
jgi:uncharacterized membrane protein